MTEPFVTINPITISVELTDAETHEYTQGLMLSLSELSEAERALELAAEEWKLEKKQHQNIIDTLKEKIKTIHATLSAGKQTQTVDADHVHDWESGQMIIRYKGEELSRRDMTDAELARARVVTMFPQPDEEGSEEQTQKAQVMEIHAQETRRKTKKIPV